MFYVDNYGPTLYLNYLSQLYMESMKLDIAYRWLFGMIDKQDVIEIMHKTGVTNVPEPVPVEPLFGGQERPVLKINTGSEHEGFACANHLKDIYYSHTNNMRCASTQELIYRPIINHIKYLMDVYSISVVMVDLSNMIGGGNMSGYCDILDQLPVQYLRNPVLYIVIRPSNITEQPEYYGNKVIIPTVCLIPKGGKLMPCNERGVGETDDILLISIYEYIYRDFPGNTYILSGDQYKWMGQNNLPLQFINMLRLIRRPIGLSNFSLAKNSRNKANRIYAYDVPRHQSRFGQIAETTSDRYKDVLCKQYTKYGTCPRGDNCHFAHGLAELPPGLLATGYKTVQCKKYPRCYHKNCKYIHPGEYL